jgi:uncharacterized membrane protein (DUF106 family)
MKVSFKEVVVIIIRIIIVFRYLKIKPMDVYTLFAS